MKNQSREATSPETRYRLDRLHQDRKYLLRRIRQLQVDLMNCEEALEDKEREVVRFYNESDVSLREVAEVLEIDFSAVSRRAKKMREEHTHDADACCECGDNHCCCECPVFDAPGTPSNHPANVTRCLDCGHGPGEHDDSAEAACRLCGCEVLHLDMGDCDDQCYSEATP